MTEGSSRTQRVMRLFFMTTVAGGAIGALLGVAIYFLLPAEEATTPLRQIVSQQVRFFAGWGVLITPLWWVLERVATLRSRVMRAGSIIVAGAICGIVNTSFMYLTADSGARGAITFAGLISFLPGRMYIQSIVFAAIVSAMAGLRNRHRAHAHERHAAALAVQLSRAQLRALQAQLHPHFLFNALNTVSMLARAGDTQRIVEVTGKLGDLLRAMLQDAEQECTLRDELSLTSQYLAIERIRFADRLQVSINVPDDLLSSRVPRFVLQPIVENAMRHGIAPRAESGRITLSAERTASQLILKVHDDGVGASSPDPMTSQADGDRPLGLRLTRERLQALYGAAATLTMTHGKMNGTHVTVVLPWHTSPLT